MACRVGEGGERENITLLIVLRLQFIMTSPQLGPFGELVLRTRRVHFSLQLHNVSAQRDGAVGVARGGGGEFVVEGP